MTGYCPDSISRLILIRCALWAPFCEIKMRLKTLDNTHERSYRIIVHTLEQYSLLRIGQVFPVKIRPREVWRAVRGVPGIGDRHGTSRSRASLICPNQARPLRVRQMHAETHPANAADRREGVGLSRTARVPGGRSVYGHAHRAPYNARPLESPSDSGELCSNHGKQHGCLSMVLEKKKLIRRPLESPSFAR